MAGDIIASKYVIGACTRYLNDLDRSFIDPDCPFYFNFDKAERYLKLVQNFSHVIGKGWKSDKIMYEGWQKFIFACIMGFYSHETGERRFRTAHVEVSRGNGKALCLNTDVPTPDKGLVKFGTLQIGDKLYSSDGNICTIKNKNEIHFPSAYRVTFSDGTQVDCSGDHLWVTAMDLSFLNLPLPRTTEEIYHSLNRHHTISRPRPFSDTITIIDVVPIPPKPMFCIEVDSPDKTFLITDQYIPTHNSAMASQSCLYFLALDDSKGNHIACAATRREQARIVLDSARAMARASKDYIKATGVEVLAHKIVQDSTNSHVVAVSSDHSGLDGRADILSICDELHQMDEKTFETIESGMAKRNDSLLLAITTAGYNVEGIGYSQSVYAKKVCTGEVIDDSFFAIVYTLDDGDDIFDERNWYKANPNLGVSVDITKLRAVAAKAKESPRDIPNFKIKNLNIWLSESRAFFDVDAWDRCADPDLRFEDFYGQNCQVGIDLASKIDLASFAYVFRKDDIYYIFDKTYVPEERVKQIRSALYENCIGKGYLYATPGEAIHYEKLLEEFLATSKNVNVLNGLFDPWNAISFGQKCIDERINMVEFRMNVANFSEPTKNLDALIRRGFVRHNGSPLLRWCLGNVVVKEDAAGNIYPRKSNEKLKIDPIISIIMCIAQWMNEEETSVYESRGIRTL